MKVEPQRCACGWERPLIGLTTLEGPAAPANIVPVYNCPKCGQPHVPTEIPEEIAQGIIRGMSRAQRHDYVYHSGVLRLEPVTVRGVHLLIQNQPEISTPGEMVFILETERGSIPVPIVRAHRNEPGAEQIGRTN